MKLKFKKGSVIGDYPSCYQAQLPDGLALQLCKSGGHWVSYLVNANGDTVNEDGEIDWNAVEEFRTKQEASSCLRRYYESKFND